MRGWVSEAIPEKNSEIFVGKNLNEFPGRNSGGGFFLNTKRTCVEIA